MWHCCLPSNLHEGEKKMTTPAPVQRFQAKGLLFSQDACNRHRPGKDAKQLAGKKSLPQQSQSGSILISRKLFPKWSTVPIRAWRQRAALCGLSVYFSSPIKFTAKRQATGDRPPSSRREFCHPHRAPSAPPRSLPLPASTALATTEANMCDLPQLTA